MPGVIQEASVHTASGAPAEWRGLKEVPDAEKGGLPGMPLSLAALLSLLEGWIARVLCFGVLTHPLLPGRSELGVIRVPALQILHLSAVFLASHVLGGDKILNILYAGAAGSNLLPYLTGVRWW